MIQVTDNAKGYAVLGPDGSLEWFSPEDQDAVEALVCGEYAPGATDRAWLGPACPLKLVASDVALIAPDHYAPNPLAERLIPALSGGYVRQSWRGHVALFEHSDGFAVAMSEDWVQRITQTAASLRTT